MTEIQGIGQARRACVLLRLRSGDFPMIRYGTRIEAHQQVDAPQSRLDRCSFNSVH